MDFAQKFLIAGLLVQAEQDQVLANHEKYRIVPFVVITEQLQGLIFLAICAHVTASTVPGSLPLA
jgi:hypothetical protein